MTTLYQTNRYRLDEDRFGFMTLTRLDDRATAFFQSGDDCQTWREDVEACERLYGKVQSITPDQAFNHICDSYSEVMDA